MKFEGSGLQPRRVVLDALAMRRALRRVAHQIVEGAGDLSTLALIGVRTRGVPLARRLQAVIAEAEGFTAPVGELDITLYRDDVYNGLQVPEVRPTHLPFAVDGRNVVLVDDVLFTGRTVRAALDAVMDWGRPRCIRLAALVDRGHRELPLHGDYVGATVETAFAEAVQVRLAEIDGEDEVVLWSPSERGGER
ncbi:MAG: bifunctional pyr operon transcriptional regulator/uracil phosphoribosyltransferase PyrR [Myxococcales bacterium]|nr:bifunctional pyr operon transcriptional regulator/uracil phosphoribosyltransferase PyrR [Myxococcales bacterium]